MNVLLFSIWIVPFTSLTFLRSIQCLHEFRYRKMRSIPPFKARQGRALKNTIAKGGRKDVIATDLSKYEMGGKPVVAFNTVLEVK